MKVLKRLFKRKSEFAIFIARRGGRKWIAKIEAEDIAEAVAKAYKILEERLEKDPDVTKWRSIVIVDLKTGYEERIANPFFEEEESEGSGTSRSSRSEIEALKEAAEIRLLAAVTNSMAEAVKAVGGAMGQMMGEMVKGVAGALSEVVSETIKRSVATSQPVVVQPQQQMVESPAAQLKALADFINSLVNLAQNWPQVKEIVREAMSKMREVSQGGGSSSAS